MARLGMVIDLQRCVGCGACAFACKAENNTRTRGGGQSHNWADFLMKTEGTFPRVTHWVMPVLCNHCSAAPCVAACPVDPKALFKTPEGITMHDQALCIGCRLCQEACPYSVDVLDPGLVRVTERWASREALAAHFKTLATLRVARESSLSRIEGVGPIIGKSVADW